jgi:hypothetical protein
MPERGTCTTYLNLYSEALLFSIEGLRGTADLS